MKKITKATFKSFIRKNEGKLFIRVKSSFNGMIDGCEDHKGGFEPTESTERNADHTCGIAGVWLVGQSNDSFNAFDNDEFEGIEVYNSCGCFIVAIKKEQPIENVVPAVENEVVITTEMVETKLEKEYGMKCRVHALGQDVVFFGTELECYKMAHKNKSKESTVDYSTNLNTWFVSFPEWLTVSFSQHLKIA